MLAPTKFPLNSQAISTTKKKANVSVSITKSVWLAYLINQEYSEFMKNLCQFESSDIKEALENAISIMKKNDSLLRQLEKSGDGQSSSIKMQDLVTEENLDSFLTEIKITDEEDLQAQKDRYKRTRLDSNFVLTKKKEYHEMYYTEKSKFLNLEIEYNDLVKDFNIKNQDSKKQGRIEKKLRELEDSYCDVRDNRDEYKSLYYSEKDCREKARNDQKQYMANLEAKDQKTILEGLVIENSEQKEQIGKEQEKNDKSQRDQKHSGSKNMKDRSGLNAKLKSIQEEYYSYKSKHDNYKGLLDIANRDVIELTKRLDMYQDDKTIEFNIQNREMEDQKDQLKKQRSEELKLQEVFDSLEKKAFASNEISVGLENENQDLARHKDNLQAEIAQKNQMISSLKAKVKEDVNSLERNDAQLVRLGSDSGNILDEMDHLQKRNSILEEKNLNLEEQFSKEQLLNFQVSQQNDKLQKNLEDLMDCKVSTENSNDQLVSLQTINQKLAGLFANEREKNLKSNQEISAQKTTINDLENKIKVSGNLMKQISGELKVLQKDREKDRYEIDQHKQVLEPSFSKTKLIEENSSLQKDIESMKYMLKEGQEVLSITADAYEESRLKMKKLEQVNLDLMEIIETKKMIEGKNLNTDVIEGNLVYDANRTIDEEIEPPETPERRMKSQGLIESELSEKLSYYMQINGGLQDELNFLKNQKDDLKHDLSNYQKGESSNTKYIQKLEKELNHNEEKIKLCADETSPLSVKFKDLDASVISQIDSSVDGEDCITINQNKMIEELTVKLDKEMSGHNQTLEKLKNKENIIEELRNELEISESRNVEKFDTEVRALNDRIEELEMTLIEKEDSLMAKGNEVNVVTQNFVKSTTEIKEINGQNEHQNELNRRRLNQYLEISEKIGVIEQQKQKVYLHNEELIRENQLICNKQRDMEEFERSGSDYQKLKAQMDEFRNTQLLREKKVLDLTNDIDIEKKTRSYLEGKVVEERRKNIEIKKKMVERMKGSMDVYTKGYILFSICVIAYQLMNRI